MRFISLLVLYFVIAMPVQAEWRGHVSLESRQFLETGDQGQDKSQNSLKVEPEYFYQGEESLFTLQFMARTDAMDDNRTHADIRELSWLTYGDDWEFKVGISKVFWGVAETQHLVDIINQTDSLENIDAEDKLGQPMMALTLMRDWGNIDFYLLPYFRERQFAGVEGRFRAPYLIDTDYTTYASGDEEKHLDGAVRWSHTLGDWDVGLSHFSGTSRAPVFQPMVLGSNVILAPHYTTIDQTGLDIQATLENWLWKLEWVSNSGFHHRRYTAAVFGFEYSFYDLAESGIDLGMIVEYQYDDRGTDLAGTPVLDNVVIGSRLAFNDEQSSEVLIGLGINEASNQFWNIEASRRIGDEWKVTLEARILSQIDESTPTASPFYAIRNDSFIMLELARYF